MNGAMSRQRWFLLCLFVSLADSSVAQALQPQKRPDKPDVKMPAFFTAKALKEDSTDDEFRKLLKARYNEALRELKAFYEATSLPGVERLYSLDDLYGPWQRLRKAGLELFDKPADRTALLIQYLEMTREAEKTAKERYDAGRAGIGDFHRARYERLDAEIQLLRAKREAEKSKK